MVGLGESIKQVRESMHNHDLAQEAHTRSQQMHERILDEYADVMGSRGGDGTGDADRKRDRERDSSQDGVRTGDGSGARKREREGHRDGARDGPKERERGRESRQTSMRFRFKSDDKAGDDKRRKRRRKREHKMAAEDDANIRQYAAHPFARPRNPDGLDPSMSHSPQPEPVPAEPTGPDDAFRDSLFDAIADDEGAAYWEGVYSQPIHVYPRPQVQNDQGHLEQMTDDQYAEYVKTKMWEKRNPEVVEERRRRAAEQTTGERKRRPGEDDDEGDYEWVGDEERGYERRYAGARPKPKIPKDSKFLADVEAALARGVKRKESKKRQQLWHVYQQRWQDLKDTAASLEGKELRDAIPWPVDTLNARDVAKENIDNFFYSAVLGAGETKMGMLKAERFRWHPDKIQHRFGGANVDEETMRLVTAAFQTIDEMLVVERQKAGKE